MLRQQAAFLFVVLALNQAVSAIVGQRRVIDRKAESPGVSRDKNSEAMGGATRPVTRHRLVRGGQSGKVHGNVMIGLAAELERD